MTPELIISIISLCSTFIVGVLTVFANIKISKIENLESKRKFDKNITNFELQFKDEQWLYNLFQSGEFDLYNIKSKRRIFAWWVEYQKDHTPVLLIPQVAYDRLTRQSSRGSGWCGSDGKGGAMRISQISTDGIKPYEDIDAEDLF